MPRRTGGRCASHARWATSPTSSTARRCRRCRARWPSATCATRPPARASCSNAQPILIDCAHGQIALCHNGNLVNAHELRDELVQQGSIFQSNSDTEVDPAPLRAVEGAKHRRCDRRVGGAGAGRVLARDADQGSADRRARSAWVPPAGARPSRRRRCRLLRDVRDGSHWRHLRARRRAGRGADRLGRRRPIDQAVSAGAAGALHFRARVFRAARQLRVRQERQRGPDRARPRARARARRSTPTWSCRCPTRASARRWDSPRSPACRCGWG